MVELFKGFEKMQYIQMTLNKMCYICFHKVPVLEKHTNLMKFPVMGGFNFSETILSQM